MLYDLYTVDAASVFSVTNKQLFQSKSENSYPILSEDRLNTDITAISL